MNERMNEQMNERMNGAEFEESPQRIFSLILKLFTPSKNAFSSFPPTFIHFLAKAL